MCAPLPLGGRGFGAVGGCVDFLEREITAADHEVIWDTQHRESLSTQIGVTFFVVRLLSLSLVRPSIQFDNQLTSNAQKVRHVRADWNLPPKFHALETRAAQRQPEHRLCDGHLASQFSGEGQVS